MLTKRSQIPKNARYMIPCISSTQMGIKESVLLEFRITVYPLGGIVIGREHKGPSWVLVMFRVLTCMPIMRVSPVGGNSLIWTLTIHEVFYRPL